MLSATPLNQSKYSALSSPQQSASTSRRRSGAGFRPSSARRTSIGFTSLNTSVNVNRSSLLKSSFIQEENYGASDSRVEVFGEPLPVIITEKLSALDSYDNLTVKIDASGWAWIVQARHVYIWKYAHQGTTRVSVCRDLRLPPTGGGQNVDLVAVMPNVSEPLVTSALVSTVDGVIRYWYSVVNENAIVEMTIDLHGEECCSVTPLQELGFLLATVSGQLYLLLPSVANSQSVISYHLLKSSKGMLAAVSSLLFRSSHSNLSKTRQVLDGGVTKQDTRLVYLLRGDTLVKWEIRDGSENIVFECDLVKLLRKCVADEIWGNDTNFELLIHNLELRVLDIQMISGGVAVLLSVTNPDDNPVITYFSLITLDSDDVEQETDLNPVVTVIKFKLNIQQSDVERCEKFKLLIPDEEKTIAYIYEHSLVITAEVGNPNWPLDIIEFSCPGDGIQGAGFYTSQPLFFSILQGLVTIRPIHKPDNNITSSEEQSSMLDSKSMLHSVDLPLIHPTSTSAPAGAGGVVNTKLKTAFLYICRNRPDEAGKLISELVQSCSVSGDIDDAVYSVSRDLINDYPASDPRWAESIPTDGSSSVNSLILLHQLEDKQRAHDHYISFLRTADLWDRLGVVHIGERSIPTKYILCENVEKLNAAISLRNSHTRFTELVDRAIDCVMDVRQHEDIPLGLTKQDMFYKQISSVDEILEQLVYLEETILTQSSQDTVKLITSVNSVFEGMLNAALEYRQSQKHSYRDRAKKLYTPWTDSEGPSGIRQLTLKQHQTTVDRALPEAPDAHSKSVLYDQLYTLANIILAGYDSQIQTLRHVQTAGESYSEIEQRFALEKDRLIGGLLDCGQYERCASLAEKYHHYTTLIKLCEETDNPDRLQRYVVQFSAQGFSDYLFKWYLDKGKRGKLLSMPKCHQNELSEFLHSHDELKWLHEISSHQYIQAQETLRELAGQEKEHLARKKNLLSLSKLSLLVSDGNDEIMDSRLNDIDKELELIFHQETLPEQLITDMNMDVNDMPVLSPEALVQYYISDENVDSNVYDFLKALDLLLHIDEMDTAFYNNLKIQIWCKSLLKNRWSNFQVSEPMNSLKNTVFFQIVQHIYQRGDDIKKFLPPVDEILVSDHLGVLQNNVTFQYLIKAGYEEIDRLLGRGDP